MKFYIRPKNEVSVAYYYGTFRRRLSLFQGVALIVSGTIGAGVLGIPYAVAKVGIGIGLLYILGLGLLMMGLNLLLGEVAVRTKEELQVVGLAGKYLGKVGKWVMTGLVYIMSFGILTIYIIGEGQTLSALLSGSPFVWSLLFWAFGCILILSGMRTIKTVELFLTLGVLAVIAFIVMMSSAHIEYVNWQHTDLAHLLLPYGIILFAFSGTAAVPEAHSILQNRDKLFKEAIIIAGIISIVAYALFTTLVVGVTGFGTTEIATIGLGEVAGVKIAVLGNLFACLAMGTSFLLGGMALRDSFHWDFKISKFFSTTIVCVVPLLIFLLGVRSFIATIDVIGGVFMSLQMLLIVLIYWRAKQAGDLPVGKFKLHHTLLLVLLLVLALTVGAVYSVVKLF